MKLSEAILLGLPEIRFTNDYWFERNPDGSCEGCLVGAALYARGFEGDKYPTNQLGEYWPWVLKAGQEEMRCPICGRGNCWVVLFLTDLAFHYLRKEITGEEIAAIVRSIEPAEEEAPAAEPVLEPAEMGAKSR